MIFRTLPALLAALTLLAGCAARIQPTPSALPSVPVALPQARAALEQGQYEVAVALAGPWAATSPEAADLVAEAHLARAEAALRGAPDSAAARQRNSLNELALAISIAPKGGLRDRIAARMAELTHATEPTATEPTAAAQAPSLVAASPAPRPQAATPTPLPQPARPAYVVAERKSFEGSGESGRFESCVDVQVIAQSGPVAGAVVAVNNGDHSYQSQTDAGGYTGRCGLGPSTWSVVLFWTPDGGDSGVATTVYLSGAPEQRAAVTFEQH